ncbi:glycosyltransferase [Halomonas sp. ANAO-440]|uniref:glycosyltransferase n=1 Tax=Halomonas sp. ANAO-440 TaxID=2861360 RepID=UPI001CAA5B6A|nr:glycosyltransferase [Halomonas sp. ANAO-440]MBZ0331866.1 glycosyltransferase [Halomonas sp. ANAO-440]
MNRVLFITDHLGGGGAPISILALASALAARGCSVTIVSLQNKVWHEPPEGVDFHVVGFTYRGPWQKFRRYNLHALRLNDWIASQSQPFDLIVANMHYSHQVAIRSCLADRAWLCIRTDPGAELTGSRRSGRVARLRHLYHGRRVLCISQGIQHSLAELGIVPAELKVVHNIIDASAIQLAMQEPVPYEDFIVFVGRLDKRQKRYDRLFQAYKASGISQRLVVVGDGEVDEARQFAASIHIAERVSFAGKQPNPYPYIHHARLLVLSSDYEGFGRVIAEALVCGTPVVSTDCPSGPREILTGGLSACLVPLDDGEMLGRRIAETIASPPAIRAEHYSPFMPEVIVKQYIQLFYHNASCW